MLKLKLLIVFIIISSLCLGQDTIRVEPSHYYNSKDDPLRGKNFYFKVKYSREEIVFNENHKKIEYCYYYDNERNCYGTTYNIFNDSILLVGDSSYTSGRLWKYKKLKDGNYFVERYYENVYEAGNAKTLIPFERTGIFTTFTKDKLLALWKFDYTEVNSSTPYSKPKFIYPNILLKQKIYTIDEVDQPPFTSNGDNLPDTISLKRIGWCIGEPLSIIKTMSFIVTSKGQIINIRQEFGNFKMDFCPYYVLDLIKIIAEYGVFIPAKRNGENVNVKYIVAVDMKN